jgi:hypothetical protein
MTPEERSEAALEMFRVGGYSPVYQPESDMKPGLEVIDQKEDIKRREFNLVQMKSTGTTVVCDNFHGR